MVQTNIKLNNVEIFFIKNLNDKLLSYYCKIMTMKNLPIFS